MNSTLPGPVVDARSLPPRARHPAIFKAWHRLADGEALLLVNDHDPLPLYYQLHCEHRGTFRWEYLERGPDRWQVRITKGRFPDPGFVPATKRAAKTHAPVSSAEGLVVDTRPIFASGGAPCHAIDDAVARLAPGQPLVLLVPFEPAPLYAKLGRDGFSHHSTQLADGTWRVEFRKGACCAH